MTLLTKIFANIIYLFVVFSKMNVKIIYLIYDSRQYETKIMKNVITFLLQKHFHFDIAVKKHEKLKFHGLPEMYHFSIN